MLTKMKSTGEIKENSFSNSRSRKSQRALSMTHQQSFAGSVRDLNTVPEDEFSSGCLLLLDCAKGNLAGIKKKLSAEKELLTFRDYDRRSPLHVSASEGHYDVVSMLLEMNANPNHSDRWGGSPLDDAQRHRFPKVAALLRKHGGRAGVKDFSAAMIVAASSGDVAQIQELVDDGASVNSQDYDQRTPLHLAASEGYPEAVQMLIEMGADVNCVDRWGGTPLDDARRRKQPECIKLLEDQGAIGNATVSMPKATSKEDLHAVDAAMEADWSEITVIEKIGAGAFGDIFKCRWRGTTIAAKMMKPSEALAGAHAEAVADFKQEISFLLNLRHPNICLLLGYSLHDGREVMLSELMKCSLLDVMKAFAGTPFAIERATRYAIQFAQGMAFLHTCKPPILHRDLKPANLLLDYTDTLKVADFGLAKLRKSSDKDASQAYRMTGETGSYRYMAPEVFRHEDYGLPVDVYSFAMILYYMLVGEAPFSELDGQRAVQLAATEGERPTLPRSVDVELQELVRTSWSDNPVNRPSFTAILEQLNQFHLMSFKMTFEDKMAGKTRPQSSSSACSIM